MNVARSLGSQLPLLRRYTRALTGSQASGDAYVAALLEALIAEPSLFDGEADPRVEVYRLISALWSSLEVNMEQSEPEGWEAAASRKLSAIAPRARQAFLLTSVEGFTLDEAATILETGTKEVGRLIDEASREIADQVRTRILIIEDEPLIAIDIEKLVSELGHAPTGVARTHAEAVRLAKADPPGLVLADIQLADGSSGIDAVHDILKGFDVPVIFITAFPERLLTGEKPEPAFLITKPFLPEMVKAIISQALFFERNAGTRSAAE
jgi:DNA-directed RNA polymerase specialized sigma24 family protein/CheY-like chemotaxis protein